MSASKLEFLERFALGDRHAALSTLVPGTAEHFQHAALLAEQRGFPADLDAAVQQYAKAHPTNPGVRRYNDRKLMMQMDAAKKPTARPNKDGFDMLRERLGVRHHHQQRLPKHAQAADATLSAMPAGFMDTNHMVKAVLATDENLASALTSDSGARDLPLVLAALPGNVKRIHEYFHAYGAPDLGDDVAVARLVADCFRDFSKAHKDRAVNSSPNFMLRHLSLAQLRALGSIGAVKAALLSSSDYVAAVVGAMAPCDYVDLDTDLAARAVYLDDLGAFADTLPPVFRSLQLAVAYHRLKDHQLAHGSLAAVAGQFKAYVAIPRQAHYWQFDPNAVKDMQRDVLARVGSYPVPSLPVGLPSASDDQTLVLAGLMDCFADGSAKISDFQPYLTRNFLWRTEAQAKLLAGVAAGDASHVEALGGAVTAKALADRVDIDLAPHNKKHYAPADPVTVHVHVKNVAKLTVKVFEINTTAVYRDTGAPISTSIELDGMVPTEELEFEYADVPPVRRVARAVDLPSLSANRRGVFVVELIGNGVSSRAVICKGQLHFVERHSVAGHVLRVLDESNTPVDPSLVTMSLGGRTFRPDDTGDVVVPYATPGNAGVHDVILSLHEEGGGAAAGAGAGAGAAAAAGAPSVFDRVSTSGWSFSSLASFNHIEERYTLSASFLVNRESLIRDNRSARVAVRATLSLLTPSGPMPAPLAALESVKLTVTSVDDEGTEAQKAVDDFALTHDVDTHVDLPVPYNLRRLTFCLDADVRVLATNAKQHLAATGKTHLNDIDDTTATHDLFMAHDAGAYRLMVLGKSGEPITNQKLDVSLQHRMVSRARRIVLKTDDAGVVALGPLPDVTSVHVATAGITRIFTLFDDLCTAPSTVHTTTTASPQVAVSRGAGAGEPLSRMDASLRAAGSARTDMFEHLTVDDAGYLTASGLPVGQYVLTVKQPTRVEYTIDVINAKRTVLSHWVGDRAVLQASPPGAPLRVASVEVAGGDTVRVRVTGGDAKTTRVHVAATRFLPQRNVAVDLHRDAATPRAFGLRPAVQSLYLSGRKLGDEHRYVLERRAHKPRAGNNLPRPGLLLNPWAVGSTETNVQDAAAGAAYASMAPSAPACAPRSRMCKRQAAPRGGALTDAYSNFDFLAAPGVLLTNLTVDADGCVAVAAADLSPCGGSMFCTVIAVDAADSTAAATVVPVSTPEVAAPHRPLQLQASLDVDTHVIQQRRVKALQPGEAVDVAIASDTKTEEYDTVGKLFALYTASSGNSDLASKFDFLPKWASLDDGTKEKKYSEFACHEVNLFLYVKDRPFFDRVVRPFLACKRSMSFMDHWLLGHDVSLFAEPARFMQLNAAEKALLCKRLKDTTAQLPRTLRDTVEAAPTSRAVFEQLFRQAIAGKALEEEGGATHALRKMAEEKRRSVPMPTSRMMERSMRSEDREEAKGMARAMMMSRSMAMEEAEPMNDCDFGIEEDEDDDSDMDEAWGDSMQRHRSMDMDRRRGAEQSMFQDMDKTQEFAEMHYYKVRNVDNPQLVPLNEFWVDFAHHCASGAVTPFVSPHVLLPTQNSLTAMLLALAVTELPLEPSSPPTVAVVEGVLRFTANATPAVVFYKDMATVLEPPQTTVLVGQNYFDPADRFTMVKGARVDKYVTSGEFLAQKVYGAQVVVTNVSCSQQSLDVLLQIPQGALPVQQGFVTRTKPCTLSAYSTERIEYLFYFPHLGRFSHYPVHVASDEALVACARPLVVDVVDRPTHVDTTSWAYVSQQGTDDDVLAFLTEHSLATVALEDICWRLHDAGMYKRVVAALRARLVFNSAVWSYSLLHGDFDTAREYLATRRGHLDAFAPVIDAPLLTLGTEALVGHGAGVVAPLTASASAAYEHLEYDPLVNARAHQLGATRQIMNKSVSRQYKQLLTVLSHKAAPTANDLMAATYHLLLQDRVEEAKALFARVPAPALPGGAGGAVFGGASAGAGSGPAEVSGTWSALQYHYMAAYLDFFTAADPASLGAGAIAEAYADFPVPKWANKFREVRRQLAEAQALDAPADADAVDPDDVTREQRMAQQASADPTLSLAVDGGVVRLTHTNVAAATLRFYTMDIELLFSNNPFVSAGGDGGGVGSFAYIRPNAVQQVALAAPARPGAEQDTQVPLPDAYRSANVMVEAVSGGVRASQAHYSNAMRVQVSENFGQVKVTSSKDGAPLPRVYVKVYSRRSAGDSGKFYKDGYTDICGRFDYTSLNTDELKHVQRFALLVSSVEHGAVVREARPPKQ